MITPQRAQADYEEAVATLQTVALTPGISSAERFAARDAIRELTDRYLGQLEAEIQALTAQYTGFIQTMTSVVDALAGGTTPKSVLNRLTALVTSGSKLVGAVAGVAAGAAPPGAKAFGARGGRTRAAGLSAGNELKILCVHGIGHQEADPAFEDTWIDAITSGLVTWRSDRPFRIEFVAYDDLFAADPPSALDVAKAVVKLGASGLFHSIGDLFRRRRGFGDIAESVRWTAGMVVQWAENNRLRAAARQRVLDHTTQFQPDVILAHSLGTLLSYDAFARAEGRALVAGRTFVSFGSQIGNPFVRSTLGGRIEPLKARRWYHLFNRHDDAFTAPLRIPAENFEQVPCDFDIAGMLDHDAGEYLRHANTTNVMWRAVALSAGAARGAARGATDSALVLTKLAERARPAKISRPRQRALLVGINDYPNEADRLEGCVNDVFLMSSLLQESGFKAEDIRVVLNERATAAGIIERMEWLLDGAEDGQDRVFYYSGHGAQIPTYGAGDKIDGKDECLVAYDFDWSRERAVTDDQFFDFYSQLPYKTRFLAIFDCCHSGGMHRHGSARVRGLTPPDDIRHRELKWSTAQQMWVGRDFEDVKPSVEERSKKPKMFGEKGDLNRLGRSADLRQDKSQFERARKEFAHKGPFMPVIFQACEEKQFSYEYRHGVQSYGAFTYSLGLILRNAKKKLTWTQLIDIAGKKLQALRYDQTPCLVCPTALKNQKIPWGAK